MTHRPLLFLDVDGVLALWDPAVEVDILWPSGRSGAMVQAPVGATQRLRRLASRFDVVWATHWGEDAPTALAPCLGIGADWPVLDFDRVKWAAACDHAAGRPFAWLDDEAADAVLDLQQHCAVPHLVVQADHRVGLDEAAVLTLIQFADRF